MNSPAHSIKGASILADLPDQWPEAMLDDIRRQVTASGRKIVVLDDDPTGTQTVHGIPVRTGWSVPELASELTSEHPAFYILTNSRSMPRPQAMTINREIGRHLRQARKKTGVAFDVVSRSDSTLRGHFPEEVNALCDVLGSWRPPCLIVPCFFEGGRFTVDDVHYVAHGAEWIPAAQTSYARDNAFGYMHSNLKRWVMEKTRGRIPAEQVASISIQDLRQKGPAAVSRRLTGLRPGSACVVNAVTYRDLEVLVMGLLLAEQRGARFIYRSAASFVRIRAGIGARGLLEDNDLVTENGYGGLFVVGSYVPKTTAQMGALLARTNIVGVELDVVRMLDENAKQDELNRVAEMANNAIGRGQDVAIYTSRTLVTGTDPAGNLHIGQKVSRGLIATVQALGYPPRYLVAKGGITSSDVATRGLGVRRAMVMGQVLPGVPAWRLGTETRFPGMAYIVFPGNIGDVDALVDIKKRLTKR